MSTIITLIVGASCLVLLRLFRKPIFSVSGLFVSVWTICLSLATLGLYGMNKPSFLVIVLSCISMALFALFAVSKITITNIVVGNSRASLGISNLIGKEPLMKNKLIYLFHAAAYVFSIPYLKNSIYILVTKGIYYVREGAFNGSGGIASTAVLMIFQYVISSLFLTTIILTAIDLSNKNGSFSSIFLSLLDVVLYTLLFAGRFMMLEAILLIIIAAIDADENKNILGFIQKHKKLVILVLGLFIGLVFITLSRSSNNFIKSAYVYFCGSFSYLSYLIKHEIGTNLFLLGRTLLGFIYNTVYTVLTVFFGIEYQGSNHIITQLTQYMVPIGENITYNSMGTMLHDFIADFGVYGCIIDIAIFSYICNYIERVASVKKTDFTEALYYYTIISVVFSVLSYQFRGPGAFFTIFFLFIFTHHRRRTDE